MKCPQCGAHVISARDANYNRRTKLGLCLYCPNRVDDGHRACADCRWRKKLRAAGIQPPLKKRQLAMATASPTNAVRR